MESYGEDVKRTSRPGTDTGVSGDPAAGLELLVLEGADAGKCFTLEGSETLIGGELPPGVGIELEDRSIAPRHVALRPAPSGVSFELLDPSASPPLKNGAPRSRGMLAPGDRLRLGAVVVELRAREGASLREILSPVAPRVPSRPGAKPGSPADSSTLPPFTSDDNDGCQTLLRPVALVSLDRGHLNVLQGADLVSRTRFDLSADVMTIGRSAGSDIEVADRAVSRAHAELVWEGDALVILQKSPANYTFVNGERVSVSRTLREADRIQIADVLILQVEGLGGETARPQTAPGRFGDLSRAMEERLRIEQQIEAEFMRKGSMLDVDVAGSSEMKAPGTDPAHIILSFERFRDYVANTVREFGGVVLNSNGDELMCFFEDTYAAVRAGSAILERLDAFNSDQNLLPRPFRFRIGVHTGDCLVDLVNGRAFSPLVDLAGHLQKHAEINGLLISQATLAALPEGLPFERAGELERHGIETYRLKTYL